MTVTTLLAEITSRCGIGYENWSTRAGQYFKQAVEELIKSGNYSPSEYHGLVKTSSYTVPGTSSDTITKLDIATMLGAGFELIDIFDINYDITTTNWKVDVVSYPEKLASDLNSELKTTGHKQWYWSYSTSTDMVFETSSPIIGTTKINYTVSYWNDDPLLTGATVISNYFTERFLQDVIDLAANKLYREIKV
jgi:hypothetical protein